MFHIGLGVISWASKKKPVISQSIDEAEYIEVNATTCQAIWLRIILAYLKEEEEDGTVIFCDNVSSIALSRNHVFHGRRKHIEINYHFIRSLVDNTELKLEFCKSN